jgi:hypothetical protein
MLPETVALLGLLANPTGHGHCYRNRAINDYIPRSARCCTLTTTGHARKTSTPQSLSAPSYPTSTTRPASAGLPATPTGCSPTQRPPDISRRSQPECSPPNLANNFVDHAAVEAQETWPTPTKMANLGITGHSGRLSVPRAELREQHGTAGGGR